MLGRIRKAVSFAAGEGITVAFFGVDGSRADLDFFQRAYEAAVEAGAKEVGRRRHDRDRHAGGRRLPRRAGRRLARRAGALARPRRLRARHRRRGRRRPGGRDLGAGHGERDGRAGRQRQPARGGARARGALRDPDAARPLARRASSPRSCATGPATSSRRGRRSRATTSSRARAAPSRASSTIRPRSSRTRRSSSARERGIVLGKKSGLDSIRLKAEELGLDVPEERHAEVLAAVKELGDERSGGSSPTPSSDALAPAILLTDMSPARDTRADVSANGERGARREVQPLLGDPELAREVRRRSSTARCWSRSRTPTGSATTPTP